MWVLGIMITAAVLAGLLALLSGAAPWAVLYCVGWAAAIAGALGLGLSRRAAARALRHAALVLACVVFALPLYWLVSTSFKYEEEIVVSPPRWVPAVPRVILRSPYRVQERGPAGVTEVEHGLALRSLTVQDRQQRYHAIPAPPERWRSEGPAQLRLTQPQEIEVRYDLTSARDFALSAALPLPFPAADLVSVSVPVRADRSWHRLRVSLEVAGHRYEVRDALYLGGRRWQEWTFRLPGGVERDERDLGVWRLERTGPAPASGAAVLGLRVERASAAQVVWRKYTASYRQVYLLSEHPARYLRNSLIVVVLSVLGQVLSSALSAYAFARLRWPGRDLLFWVLLMTLMVPTQVTMAPTFLLMKHLGLYNTLAALWVPSFFGNAVYIFLLRQFMKGIPAQLEDAAKIDGYGHLGIFCFVIMPLLRPALAAVALFAFVSAWNDFLGPLLYLNDPRLYPLSLGLHEFRGEHGNDHAVLMAASTLITLPVAAMFLIFQRSFLHSLRFSGIKG